METGKWRIEFYLDEAGRDPVGEFLSSLDAKTQARFIRSIELLRERNIQAREPLVRHLEGKLWELRQESQTNIYRLIYVFASGRRILFLHGFQKKTQRTPRSEIETAQRRFAILLAREGGEQE